MEVLMKLLLTILALAAFALAQEAPAPAAAPAPEKKAEKKAPKAKVVELKGTVVSVDAIANTIVVKAKKGEETISVEAGAKIKSGKADVALGDIKADAKVAVTCKMVDGKKVATQIVETPAAAPKAAKTTKKTESSSTTTTTTEPAPAAK
jgi:hypothetical protein